LITLDPSLAIFNNSNIEPKIPWGIEANGSLIWLGYGEAEGFAVTLWGTERQAIQVVFNVEPGPARLDQQRTTEFILQNKAGVQKARQQFDRATQLTFVGELQPGPNDFQLIVLDEPTVLKQPNGDTRPLLVLLRHITIKPLAASP
ncbi:MAG: hypothetical protein D6706_15545, partial [Chloroflexi bacterium]